ncbi:glutamine synthetase family protein [Myxococcota bacterium]|nr:glutamine synthetase family protein [Myxococcota bacterium]
MAFIRIGWVDSGGVLRVEAQTLRHLASVLEDGIPLVPAAQAGLPLDGIADDPELGAVGQVWLVPDPDTVRVLPWEPKHASCMGRFVQSDGSPWAHCPRAALDRALAALEQKGLSMQAAFEHEFMLLRRENGRLQHFENSGFASARGLDHAGPILDRMASALEDQGAFVRALLKEAGRSQFEFSTEHGSPVEAANRFCVVRETIGAVAAAEGLVGTCLPLVFEPEAGNGWHLHFSLWREQTNLTGEGNHLGREAEAFVAGILDHLPALLALTAASPNSFRRIRPGAWSGAFRAWGYDHKEVPLRVPTERHSAPTNVELKSCDATANPYLALAGVITAGLDGIGRGLTLPKPIDRDPALLSETEQQVRGVAPLPANLSQALNLLNDDPTLQAALGAPLLRSYTAVKRAEIRALEEFDFDEEVSRLAEIY